MANFLMIFFTNFLTFNLARIRVPGTPEQARPARLRSGLDFQTHKVKAT